MMIWPWSFNVPAGVLSTDSGIEVISRGGRITRWPAMVSSGVKRDGVGEELGLSDQGPPPRRGEVSKMFD